MTTSVVWDLPRLAGYPAVVKHLLGSWQTSGILQLRSGVPITPVSSRQNSLSPGMDSRHDRADVVPGVDWRVSGRNRDQKLS